MSTPTLTELRAYMEGIESMKVAQLKDMLKMFNHKQTGNKPDLINRLRRHLRFLDT
jgi:hypothetical protein